MRRKLTVAGIVLAALTVGCAQGLSTPAKLAAVEPLPKPSLRPWIAGVSPLGQARSLAQIRIIFAKPVAEVTSLESGGPQEVLSHLHFEPALKGRFVVLTPRMVGFVADQAIAGATRVRVTITSGLRDLDGDTLDHDIAWTFETAPLEFSNLPTAAVPKDQSTPAPVSLNSNLRVDANAPVDVASLAEHAHLHSATGDVALGAVLVPTPSPLPGAAPGGVDASAQTWTYELTPRNALARATTYALRIDPGVVPLAGNVPTSRSFVGDIRTFASLRILALSDSGTPGRFANGDPVVIFSNPIDPKTIDGNVTISPQPSPAPRLLPYTPNDATIGVWIDPYALAPHRDYTITVGTGLKDIFGQSLTAPQTVVAHTGAFTAGMWGPSGSSVVPADANVDLNFYATNLPSNRYRAAFATVTALQLIAGASAASVLPSPAASWPQQTIGNAQADKQSVVRIRLRERLGAAYGTLAFGFFARAGSTEGTSSSGMVQLSNLGVFAQLFPGRAMVLVQHLSNGAPVAAAGVDLYRIDPNGTAAPQACASGLTNTAGEFDLLGTNLEGCYAGTRGDDVAPSLGVIAHEGADIATLQIYDYSGVYRYDVPAGWSGGALLSRGVIFSDRQMYQPGERAQLTGIAYYAAGSTVLADPRASYTVVVQDPNNATIRKVTVNTDRYGIFTLPIDFSKTQALGYYTITATGANGNVISGSLRVAQFKPPNFKMSVSLSAASAIPGNAVTARAKAAYLFGAPLEGGKARATVTRSFVQVAPPGWDDFAFGRQWFWPEQQPSVATDVLQRDLPLAADGSATVDVSVPTDLQAPMTYQVDVEATDVSNLSVSDSQSFLALPSDGLIGLASELVAPAKAAMPVRVVVTDASGKTIAGRKVRVDLQKMTYTSVSQAQEGGESAQESVKYDSVDHVDVTSRAAAVSVTLTPPQAGSYRLRATFDGASEASASDALVLAYGEVAADFGETQPSSVKITLDKKKYRVGDIASALIASPFDRADIYVSVIRNDTIYRTTMHDVSGSPRVSFRVSADMLPNAALEAVVVRRGKSLSAIKPGSLDSLSRVGLAAFNVDLSDRYLKLTVVPQHTTLAPGGAQHVTFRLRDAAGHPARGKIVAMAVNESILQLSGYRLPDLVATVFADQPISTRFADNRENLTLTTAHAQSDKGFGYGGGFLQGAAGTRVRANFLPLAYFGTVVADAAGNASVAFTVPDDLTTWRVMAVAVGEDDARFGGADSTFVTTLPLMVSPLLPQFARPGDLMDIGASVMNQTGADGTLDLRGTLSGALAFSSGESVAATQLQKMGIAGYRYPVTVGTPAPSVVAFSSVLGSARDAFSVPFNVTQHGVSESVIESGVASSALDVPVKFDRPGTLRVTVANSVVAQFVAPAGLAMNDEGVGLSDGYAARLIIAASLGKLTPKYHLHLDFNPKTTAAANMQGLIAMQRGDGGFALFARSSESDAFSSAYAIEALSFARSHGVAVESGALARALAYARDALANPSRFTWCKGDLCKAQMRFSMLDALASAGERRTDFLPEIYAQRAAFDSTAQIRLARYFLALPDWHARGVALSNQLLEGVYVTGRYAVAAPDTRWAWLGSGVAAQSQMLQLMLDRKAPVEQIDGAVRALVAQQCACGWPTPDMTAAAIRGLDAYSRTEKLTLASVTVSVGSRRLGSASFGSTAVSQTFVVDTASLSGSAVSIRSTGRVHYVVLYTYAPASDAPGAIAAFRIARTLSDVGAKMPLATMDLAPITAPVSVDAGHVFDVGLRIVVDHPVDRLVIDDALPAGFEAVDSAFQTTNPSVIAQSDAWQIDDRQIYRDHVTAFAGHLWPGIYEMHYLVRSVTPGRYGWPGARVFLRDAPEQFGRSASGILEVK